MVLYHGTTMINDSSIQIEGIKKKGRQFVHLSSKYEEAVIVAKRRKGEIKVLEIDAGKAFEEGVAFFKSGNVWLCEYIPSKYLLN